MSPLGLKLLHSLTDSLTFFQWVRCIVSLLCCSLDDSMNGDRYSRVARLCYPSFTLLHHHALHIVIYIGNTVKCSHNQSHSRVTLIFLAVKTFNRSFAKCKLFILEWKKPSQYLSFNSRPDEYLIYLVYLSKPQTVHIIPPPLLLPLSIRLYNKQQGLLLCCDSHLRNLFSDSCRLFSSVRLCASLHFSTPPPVEDSAGLSNSSPSLLSVTQSQCEIDKMQEESSIGVFFVIKNSSKVNFNIFNECKNQTGRRNSGKQNIWALFRHKNTCMCTNTDTQKIWQLTSTLGSVYCAWDGWREISKQLNLTRGNFLVRWLLNRTRRNPLL